MGMGQPFRKVSDGSLVTDEDMEKVGTGTDGFGGGLPTEKPSLGGKPLLNKQRIEEEKPEIGKKHVPSKSLLGQTEKAGAKSLLA